MTTYYETKEEYLTFRKAWAKACNDPRCKKVLKENNWGKYRTNSWLTAAHHVLFNILSRRPFESGFTPITNSNKLRNGAYLNFGLYFAVYKLKRVVEYAKSENQSDWQQRILNEFLEPLKDVVSVELLATIEVPEVKVMESTWAKGERVAKLIIDGEAKPITYQDLWKLYEEAA